MSDPNPLDSIPATGRIYGLEMNWWYDGRRDVVESTRAALDYLQFLHDEFNGDWLLAVAAYNCGEAAVARAIANNVAKGKPTDFWSLKLPKETQGYVPRLLAMRRLVADPHERRVRRQLGGGRRSGIAGPSVEPQARVTK